MRVFCCQFDIAWEDRQANYDTVRRLVKSAAIPAGSLVVLPEMFSTGFSMNPARTVEPAPSETEGFLAGLSRQLGAYVMGGVVRPVGEGKGANESVTFSPEGVEVARYRKMQPFSMSGEGDVYEAGEAPVTCVMGGVAVAPLICYDLRFPEVFRAAVVQGAQLFAVIANWPETRIEHWVTLLRARAIENLAYVVGVNRIGSAPGLNYTGRTLVVDPQGTILADAGSAEDMIEAEVNPEVVVDWRKAFPALRDMRKDGWRGRR